jgi:Zn-dependent M16 (insulinase) family peptidase
MQFVQELLTGANVGDLKQLKLVLNNYKTDFADSVTYSAHSFASLCAASVFSPIQWEGEQLSGLHQWFFLESIEEKDLPSIAQELERLQRKLSNRRRLLLHLSCDEALVQEFVPVYEAFTKAFSDQGVVQPVPRSYKEVSKGTIHEVQLYRLPATVSYAAWAMRTEKRGTVLQAAQILLANILTGNDLWEVIRGQGGAYGVAANADVMEEICVFSTYRDPRIAGTYRDFIKILNKYAQIDIDPGHIENALIATIGSELKPLSPSQDSILAFRRLFYHISDEFRAMRRQHLLQLDSKQLNEGAKALLRSAKEEDSYVVLSGAQLLEAEKEKHPILDRPSIRLPL